MTRYAMVIDLRRCVGCDSCTIACKVWNELPIDVAYCPVYTDGPTGVYPDVHMTYLPTLCMHCENAPCVHACPTGASMKEADGIVWVDPDKCMGCRACVEACPYGARHFDKESGVVLKCTFCKDRVREGQEPFCVHTCHQRARIFGDLEDTNSEVYRLVNSLATNRLLEDLGTNPHVYYIPAKGGQG